MNTTSPNPLIIISGATATGKTGLAIRLAKAIEEKGQKSEIINADSLLFYRELNIGTAKPSEEERKEVCHHLIDTSSVTEPLNANDYTELALLKIKELHDNKIVPILVGGSAFYLRALILGMYESVTISSRVSEEVAKLEKVHGWEAVRNKLKELDLKSYEKVHANDKYRTVRALEYTLETGSPFSLQRVEKEESGAYDFSRPQRKDWEILHLYLELPKEVHWKIMRKRVEQMIEEGLLQEVEGLLKSGLSPDFKPMQSIGYKETIAYLQNPEIFENDPLNKVGPLENLIERIFINTRKLAKSQKTFFNKITPKHTYNSVLQEAEAITTAMTFIEKWGQSKEDSHG